MSRASRLIEDYFTRTGQSRDSALDAAFAYQRTLLRDMISRLDVILDDEGVPPDTAVRVMRCLLYGAPSAADAELRIRQDAEMTKFLNQQVVAFDDKTLLERLGLPPA